jgi:hypothetical protein
MEVRSIFRSGPTKLPQVKASRDAFFGQKLLVERGVWDRYLFDNDPGIFFRLSQSAIWDGAHRIELGKTAIVDQWVLRNVDAGFKPKEAFISTYLRIWSAVPVKIEPENPIEATVLKGSYSGTKEWQTIQVNRITIDVPEPQRNMRYLKIPGKAVNVGEATAYQNGSSIDGTGWRASSVSAETIPRPRPSRRGADRSGSMKL